MRFFDAKMYLTIKTAGSYNKKKMLKYQNLLQGVPADYVEYAPVPVGVQVDFESEAQFF